MASLHGKAGALLLNEFNLSSYLNSMDSAVSVDQGETTTFGNSAKTYLPGLRDGTTSIGGYFDSTATTGADVVLAAAMAGVNKVLTIAPAGLATIGLPAKLSLCNPSNYKVSTPVGGIVSFTADLPPTGGVLAGYIAEILSAKTNAGNSSSSIDNAAASSNGMTANLHCTSYTSGTLTAKVQDSADNSTFADIITFTALTAVGSQQASVTGTVRRYTRPAWTGTFAATFAISTART